MGSAPLVILDCDGVLFDSFDANVAFYDAILSRIGLPPLDEEGREYAHRLATPQILEWRLGHDAGLLEQARRIAQELDYTPFLSLLHPVPGLFDVLGWLAERFRTAMATNRGRTIPQLVEHFALGRYFELVVGIHDVPRPKPAPDMLNLCLTRLAVEAASAVYVGDSPTDLAAAEAAGIGFISVGAAVDHPRSIASLAELPAALGDW
jgi:HAD superfamily hydrolase (TIGR01509 family)